MLASARDRSGSILQSTAGLDAGHDIVNTQKPDSQPDTCQKMDSQ